MSVHPVLALFHEELRVQAVQPVPVPTRFHLVAVEKVPVVRIDSRCPRGEQAGLSAVTYASSGSALRICKHQASTSSTLLDEAGAGDPCQAQGS